MEPITYANGSTLEDPAITYGIVFSNFMSKGVFTFEGGTDRLIELMHEELIQQRRRCADQVRCREDSASSGGRVSGVRVNGRDDQAAAPSSRTPISRPRSSTWSARSISTRSFVDEAEAVRLNNQQPGLHGAEAGRARSTRALGDLCSARRRRCFAPSCCLSRDVTSRTYSFYYPAHPAGQRSLLDRVEHERQLRGLGRAFATKNTRPASTT